MAFKLANRVLEDASNQPTASQAYNLSGTAVTGFRTFASQLANGDQVLYLAEQVDASGNPSGAWEVGLGTFSTGTPNTISRDTLYDSSSGSFIDWSAAGATPRLSISADSTLLQRGWELYSVNKQTSAAAGTIEYTQLDTNYNYLLTGVITAWTLTVYTLRFRFGYGGTSPTWLVDSYASAYHGEWGGNTRRGTSYSTSLVDTGATPRGESEIFHITTLIADLGGTSAAYINGLITANLINYDLFVMFNGRYWGTAGGAIDGLQILRNGTTNTIDDFDLWLYRRPKSLGIPLGHFSWL